MNPYVSLARNAVEYFVKTGATITPGDDLAEKILKEKSGIFVTIENKDKLRGCIGTYLPTKQNIAQEIIYNAIAAASEDSRFYPITEKELPELSYTVYVLSEPEPVKVVSELNPQKYGVILCSVADPKKCGLLLPDLEGIDSIEKQLFACSQKAGLDLVKENCHLFKFKVKKYRDVKKD